MRAVGGVVLHLLLVPVEIGLELAENGLRRIRHLLRASLHRSIACGIDPPEIAMGVVTGRFSQVGLLFGRIVGNSFLLRDAVHGLVGLLGHRVDVGLGVSLLVGGIVPDPQVALFGSVTEHLVSRRLGSVRGLLVNVLVRIIGPVLPRLLRPRRGVLGRRLGLRLRRLRRLLGVGDRLVRRGVRPRQRVLPSLLSIAIHHRLLLLALGLELLDGLLPGGVLADLAGVRGLGGGLGDLAADEAPGLSSHLLQLVAPDLSGVLLDLLRPGLPGFAGLNIHVGLLKIRGVAGGGLGGRYCFSGTILRVHLRTGCGLRRCSRFTRGLRGLVGI
mmetsp:Transcript_15738/g.38030  ORF Transcript_15738/g.38030 Transcript_15738/m.38030 type:complete len:329 (-) Transcript_15738:438-1424(-)